MDNVVPLNAQSFHLNVKILSDSEHWSWKVLQSQQKELAFKVLYTICHKEELPQQCKESISRYKGEKLVVIIRWNYWLSSVWIFSKRSTTADIFCIHQTLEINFMFRMVWNTVYYYHYISTLLWNMPWGGLKKTTKDWNWI